MFEGTTMEPPGRRIFFLLTGCFFVGSWGATMFSFVEAGREGVVHENIQYSVPSCFSSDPQPWSITLAAALRSPPVCTMHPYLVGK